MGNLKSYEPMDLGVQDELANEFGAGGSSEFAKIKVGKNVFRFLPRKGGWRSHFKVIHEHFEGVPDDEMRLIVGGNAARFYNL